jgi:hypothetical protein
LARPHSSSFEQRWPANMPATMSWDTFEAARKASARPSFCTWEMFDYPGGGCRVS